MNSKHNIASKVFVIAVIIQLIFLVGCNTPAATTEAPVVPNTGGQPTQQVNTVPAVKTEPPTQIAKNSVLTLSDGSKVIVMPNADAAVIQPKSGDDPIEIKINLTRGDILVIPNTKSGKRIAVVSTGYLARITGCAMAVNADLASNNFGLKCLSGNCELGTDADHLQKVKASEGWAYLNGIIQKASAIDLSKLKAMFGADLPDCPVVPVTGGEAAPANAAATSSCKDFQSKFPGTPCP
jgi:hypothetical protein